MNREKLYFRFKGSGRQIERWGMLEPLSLKEMEDYPTATHSVVIQAAHDIVNSFTTGSGHNYVIVSVLNPYGEELPDRHTREGMKARAEWSEQRWNMETRFQKLYVRLVHEPK